MNRYKMTLNDAGEVVANPDMDGEYLLVSDVELCLEDLMLGVLLNKNSIDSDLTKYNTQRDDVISLAMMKTGMIISEELVKHVKYGVDTILKKMGKQ